MQRWEDLKPDRAMLAALDAAGPRPINGDRADKNNWSNRFADQCAQIVADAVRKHTVFRRFEVRPNAQGKGKEALTFVAGGKRKKVDVIAATLASGLQLGVSLKGMNFRDQRGWQFDKNLTGRTYELQDEVRVIHGYQASAFMVGLAFLPLGSTDDKKSDRAPSSFARTVQHLRARTGRIDPTLPSQLDRLDMAAVSIYVPGDEEEFDSKGTLLRYKDPFPRGVVRYFDVMDDPPLRGRPQVASTLDLSDLVDRIAERYEGGGVSVRIQWSDPEADPPIKRAT
jgi:hypothetical protein